jgi:hypothetical protein
MSKARDLAAFVPIDWTSTTENLNTSGTVDGRDVSDDGTKLDTLNIGVSVAPVSSPSFDGDASFVETTDTVYDITDGDSFEIDPVNGNVQTITLGATRTAVATNFASGQSIIIGVDDGAAYALTWPTITWTIAGGGGAAPSLAVSGYTWIILWKQGVTLFGSIIGSP